MPRNVVHIIDSSTPQPGSVACALIGLCEYQRSREWTVTVLSGEHSQDAESAIQKADLVHVHGLFSAVIKRLWPVLRRALRPYLVSTYAMLMPRPHRTDRWRRLSANLVYQRSMLRRAFCLHALNEEESDFLKHQRCCKRVKVMPVGVAPQVTNEAASGQLNPELVKHRLLSCFGALHPSEGIVSLLKACALLGDKFDDFHLALVCPDDSDYVQTVMAGIRRQGFEERVSVVVAPTFGDIKAVIQASEVVVAPVPGPCCPIAPLQAMALGKPVLISPGCHLPEVETRQAGWQVRPDRRSLFEALGNILRMTPAELQKVGQSGPEVIRERYAWNRLGPEYLNLYARVLGRR